MITPIRKLFAPLVALFLATPCSVVRATWYGENVEKGSDIMMMDVRWPWWAESTYYANFNFGFTGTGITGYGGFAGSVTTLEPEHRPDFDAEMQAAARPGSVWSFWGASPSGEPVRVVATSEFTYPRQYVSEGASGSLGGPVWPFIRQNQWFTMMMRVWVPADVENPQYSYVGRWVKDVESKQWHLYGIMRLPVATTSFTSNAGFLEDFGNYGRSVRSLHRRLGYCRKDGQWLKSDTVTYDVPSKTGLFDAYWVVNIQPDGDHELLAMELCSNRAMLPQKLQGEPLELGKKHTFTVRQPELPSLDRPGVKEVEVQSNGRQVVVSWAIPGSAAPQFAYRIEVFDNPACQGQPRVIREERMPTVHTVLAEASIANPTVRLTITDVFDQSAAPVIATATSAVGPAQAFATAATAPGLEYELLFQDASRHENVLYPTSEKSESSRKEKHHWLSLPELKDGRRIQSGISRGFDTDLRGNRQSAYAFKFNGLLRVPASGLYVLHMQGADGYRIALDGREALAWDGPHGPAEKTAVLNLAEGDHPLAVDYFVDKASPPFFKLEWEGPGLPRQEIPRAALLHVETGHAPQVTLTATGGANGTANITVKVDPKEHQIAKTSLFLGKLQIAEASGPELTYAGPMPGGDSTLSARIVYDKDHTLDSEPQTVTVTGPMIQGWNLGVAGEAKSLRGVWQTGADTFSFFGEGEYVISRKITGDFTLTCRIDAFAGAKGESVNAFSWVGLTAREDASKNNSGWGREFGIMQTGLYGLHTTPNYSDLGGTRVNNHELPKNHPWLRVVRHGHQWTAWSSADGIAWEHGATHFIVTKAEMDAGLVFRALPQDARVHFQARVSHLTLEPGLGKDVVLPVSVAAKNTEGPRLTGVVMAQSDPNIVVARSSALGLLRSINGGKDWATANGTLTGAANCVRSVAIHPQDPQVMLRAAGRAGKNGASDSNLSLTRDGGQTWATLDFPGDFDGEGPSALCGEVVGFDPVHPEILFAGCETRGFFRSDDSGQTWKLIGAAGERITALTVNRWVRGTSDQAQLHFVTCPDSWIPLLGRGKPALSATVAVSRDYFSRDGGVSLNRTSERTDLGYFNVAFDKGAYPSEPVYATTHGIFKAQGNGESTYLFTPAQNLECTRPMTALACAGLDANIGICITQALDPAQPGRFSFSIAWAHNWRWQTPAGDLPAGGLISACGEFLHGQQWWILATDGLYQSADGGVTLLKVLDEKGDSTPRKGA